MVAVKVRKLEEAEIIELKSMEPISIIWRA